MCLSIVSATAHFFYFSAKIMIRKARVEDVEGILQVLREAKEIMVESGNPSQWEVGYPSRECIEGDIRCGHGYVCCGEDGVPEAYFAFMPGPDPTYTIIEGGEWLDDDSPYYVIHRMAKLKQSRGVFGAVIDYCATVSPNLRVDTHKDNMIMQHSLLKHGFAYCGIIYLADGRERLAYQRLR